MMIIFLELGRLYYYLLGGFKFEEDRSQNSGVRTQNFESRISNFESGIRNQESLERRL